MEEIRAPCVESNHIASNSSCQTDTNGIVIRLIKPNKVFIDLYQLELHCKK